MDYDDDRCSCGHHADQQCDCPHYCEPAATITKGES